MIQEWIDALERLGKRPKKKGRGWMSLCPAHDDKDPSLSVSEGQSGKVLVTCFGSCTFEAVRDALGLGSGPPQQILPSPKRKDDEPPKPRRLPNGPDYTFHNYVYATGDLAFIVSRQDFRSGGKDFKQWTPTGDPELFLPVGMPKDRPLFHLPGLSTEGRVAVVEGEKCVLAVEKAWPHQLVTCWAGGTNVWNKTDWTPLRGREVSLVADADPLNKQGVSPGHKAMKELAHHLATELECVVDIALPPVEWDSDIADWLSKDKDEAARIVEDLLQEYVPDDGDHVEPPAPPPEPLEGDIEANPYYEVLGLDGVLVAIWQKKFGQVVTKTAESLFLKNTLGAIGPMHWWYRLADTDNIGAGTATRLGDSLVRVAETKGQVDMTRITGRGAVRLDDGTVAYHLGDRLLIGGKELSLDAQHGGRIWLSEPRIELGVASGKREMQAMASAIMRYRWDIPDDGRRMLGWMVAALVGGALEWRPHVILTAPASVGKSWLIREVIQRLMGPLLTRIADATSAATARLTQGASLPISIDEAEPSNPWVIDLLKLMRVSSGAEGIRIRADGATGGVTIQAPRFTALLSATAVPSLQQADATRLTIVKLGEAVEDWPAVRENIVAMMADADAVRYRIIRLAAEIVAVAAAKVDEFQNLGMDSREALASAALTAGWQAWGLDQTDVYSRTDHDDEFDATTCLMDILALKIRLEGGREASVLDLLVGGLHDRLLADLYGIRHLEEEVSGLSIAPKHRGLRNALARTNWAAMDLKRLLLQIDGADYDNHPRRFGAIRVRSVVVSSEALERMGIELSRPPADSPENQVATQYPYPEQRGF